MNEKNIFTARRRDIVEQQIENEVLIYDLKTNKMCCLNETSAQIYRLCDGTNSIEEITRQVNAKLKTGVSEDIIWLAIEQLKQNDLLIDSADISTRFERMSRREIVKKIGFASMVALPIITSLIAPAAATASSVCSSCTNRISNQCGIPGGCQISFDGGLGDDTTGCTTSGNACRRCTCTIPAFGTSCSSVCVNR